MKVIDVRCRPPFKPYLDNLYDLSVDHPFASHLFPYRFGMNVAESVKQASMDLMFEEMDRVSEEYIGVVSIRKSARGFENDELVKLLEKYPDRFLGACGVAVDGGQDSVDELKKYIVDGPCIAPFIEPGFHGFHADDEVIFPIYEYCEQNGIPMLISFGGFHGPTADYCNPLHIDAVAKTFPKLKMALCHAGFPWVEAAVHLAFKEPNVYLSPDIYGLHAPGGRDYLEAANYMIHDKFLFGTAYPCVDIEGPVKYYLDHLRPEVAEEVMYKNAEKFFGISRGGHAGQPE